MLHLCLVLIFIFLSACTKPPTPPPVPTLASKKEQATQGNVRPLQTGYQWLIEKSPTFKENKVSLQEIKKNPSYLDFDEFTFDPNQKEFIGSSVKQKKLKKFPLVAFQDLHKKTYRLTLKTMLGPTGSGENVLLISSDTQEKELLRFDPKIWTLTVEWIGLLDQSSQLSLAISLGQLQQWNTALLQKKNTDKEEFNFVLESLLSEKLTH